MVLFDAAGLLFRFSRLDHAAHLGGFAFGLFYYFFGANLWSSRHLYLRQVEDKFSGKL